MLQQQNSSHWNTLHQLQKYAFITDGGGGRGGDRGFKPPTIAFSSPAPFFFASLFKPFSISKYETLLWYPPNKVLRLLTLLEHLPPTPLPPPHFPRHHLLSSPQIIETFRFEDEND